VLLDVRVERWFCVDVSWDWRCAISACRVAAVGSVSHDAPAVHKPRPAHTIQLSINLPECSIHRPSFLRSTRPDGIDAIHYAQRLLLIVLQHLTQLLHHGPQMIHVCLLAPRWQAIDHGYAILLCAVAVILRAVLRGRGRRRRAGLHVLLHVGGEVGVIGVRIGGEERVVVHRGAGCGVEIRAARFGVVE
jgi:hypothetical protein